MTVLKEQVIGSSAFRDYPDLSRLELGRDRISLR
jgi:hypothetical protein